VTEAEWLACTDPKPMLEHLRRACSAVRRVVGRRKLRLFGCACCRRIWGLLEPAGRKAVEVSERLADGQADEGALLLAHNLAWKANLGIKEVGAMVAEYSPWSAAKVWLRVSAKAYSKERGTTTEEERSCQVGYLRCIFDNPFRPASIKSEWLTPTVTGLAKATSDKRQLPAGTLDPARLAVLADALEDAGCTDPDLLGHLRSPGPHVRGCWALDLILGKE